jgi:hypothetical protein
MRRNSSSNSAEVAVRDGTVAEILSYAKG